MFVSCEKLVIICKDDEGVVQACSVVMWYLNDVHEGGTTDFLYSEHSIQPQAGRFLCWPAGFPWIHRGSMPISEDKYIITTWLQANWGQKVLKWNQEEEKEKTEKDS